MPETLEAEIIAIDGRPPDPGRPTPRRRQPDFAERARSVVVNLDRRWWPLWALLGILGIALLLTVGLMIGVVALALVLLRKLAGWITSPLR